MSNLASEVLSDILDTLSEGDNALVRQRGLVDKHRTDDRAWSDFTLRSGEKYAITVVKISS